MSKSMYKELNSNKFHSEKISFGDNWLLYIYENYFIIFNENDLNNCWLAISDSFKKFLILSGKCTLNIIRGSLKINGITCQAPFNQDIYSPLSHAKVTFQIPKTKDITSCHFEDLISSFIDQNNDESLDCTLLKNLFIENQPEFISKNWNLFKLTSFFNLTIEDITQFKEFRKLFEVDFDFPFARKLNFSITLQNEPDYYLSDEMKKSLDDIIKSSSNPADIKVALVGPKNAGKSSFLKTVTNELLANGHQEVCIIDGDPGQCEFSTSGCLSLSIVSQPLFGPPFTHQFSKHVKIIEQYYLGLLSPNDDPKLYCRSFERLYQKYLSICSNKHLPLIINTMGWTNGLGLLLLAFKLLLTNPSYILQLKNGKDKRDLADITPELLENIKDSCLLKNVKCKLTSKIFQLKSPVLQNRRSELNMTPQNHRDLTIIAYLFHETENRPLCFPDALPTDYDNNPVTRLRCRFPVAVKYVYPMSKSGCDRSDEMSSVFLKLIYAEMNSKINQLDCILECFSMQWVGICQPAEQCCYESVISKSDFNHSQRNETELMVCIGMGLVTHIRKEDSEMDLLTGVDKSVLNGCCLVKGKIYPPETLFLNQREILAKHNNSNLPFISPLITVGVGRTAIPTRKSLPKIRRHHHH